MPPTSKPPVVVIGAGVAGLACALDLTAAGVPVQILDASDGVGGRMRTDRQGGFPAGSRLPGVQHVLPAGQTADQPAGPAAQAVHPGRPAARGRPPAAVRRPDPAAQRRGGPAARTPRRAVRRDRAGTALRRGHAAAGRPDQASAGPDHVRRTDRRRYFHPRCASCSSARSWPGSSSKTSWKPRAVSSTCSGAACCAARCACRGAASRRFPSSSRPHSPPGPSGWRRPSARSPATVPCGDGTEIPARAVIVATGAAEAAALLPGLSVPATRTVTTFYHAAPSAPLAEPTLLVDTERKILNTVVLTEVTAAYAADGRALVSTSVLGDASGREPDVRARIAEMYGADAVRLGASGHVSGVRRAAGDARAASAQPSRPGRAPPLRLRRPPGHRFGPGRDGVRDPRRA